MSVPFKIDLTDKTAIVTGGGGVLCSAFAAALAECGAFVAVCDLDYDAANRVAEAVNKSGGHAKAYKVNVLDKQSLDDAAQAIVAERGHIDILINGAGGNNPRATTDDEFFAADSISDDYLKSAQTFFDLDPQGVKFVFDLNFIGTLLPTQVFAKYMLGTQSPCIVNVSSMNAFRPLTKIPAYSAAKSAVSNFTMWLAVHFAKTGMRVNAIAPGFFVTTQNRQLLFDQNGEPTARTQKILAATPMGRFGRPDELIGTLLYLCDSKASGFVTGSVIAVDGGFAAYSGV